MGRFLRFLSVGTPWAPPPMGPPWAPPWGPTHGGPPMGAPMGGPGGARGVRTRQKCNALKRVAFLSLQFTPRGGGPGGGPGVPRD